jgi:heptosyltransferase-1
MPRILLVKTSSLGDVVHNFPAASDIAAAIPNAEIDWVVEEAFAALPRMHREVSRVIPAAVRRWRGNLLRSETHREIGQFVRTLRATRYDAIVDTQGLFKSALIARVARGTRYGLDWRASREPLRLFYDATFHVSWEQHAVERNRALAAQALGYAIDGRVDYGVAAEPKSFGWLTSNDYAVLIHSTSAPAKLWPEERWIELARVLHARGITSVLPGGSDHERSRSERISAASPGSIVPPRIGLEDAVQLIAGARCVIGVDTGLTHLAGALGRPTVGIYAATDPARHGLYRCERGVSVGVIGGAPAVDEVTAALERVLA